MLSFYFFSLFFLLPEVKPPEREADHSASTSVEIKTARRFTPNPLL
jgi:hypothetical protein